MSATLTTPALPLLERDPDGLERPRRMTLEQRLEGAWEGVRCAGRADCPVCHAPMGRAADGSGRCAGCGSQLS